MTLEFVEIHKDDLFLFMMFANSQGIVPLYIVEKDSTHIHEAPGGMSTDMIDRCV